MLICVSFAVSQKCPVFSCSKNLTSSCELSKFNGTHSNVVVGKQCEKSYCIKNGDKELSYGHVEYFRNQNSDLSLVNLTCGNYTQTTTQELRWAGESCVTSSDCYSEEGFPVLGKCVNNTCSGVAKNSNCNKTKECVVGNWCKSVNETQNLCTAQTEIGKGCSKSEECVNNAFCNKGVCTKLYSVKIGSEVTVHADDVNDYEKKACATGYVVPLTNGTKYCMYVKYDRNATETSPFMKCTVDEVCKYKASGVDKVEPFSYVPENNKCQCGYNANGDAFCPRYSEGGK
jgi:hypothetical protein